MLINDTLLGCFVPKKQKTFEYHASLQKSMAFFDEISGVQEEGEGVGEVAFFSAKGEDRRNRADLIESATPCHDAQVVGPYWDSNPLRLTVLAAMSEDYTTAPQHLQEISLSISNNQLKISRFQLPYSTEWC